MHSKPEVSQTARETVDALMEVARLVTAVVAHSLAVLDAPVTVPQLRVLVMIGAMGPVNVSAVADALGVNPSNASRTCDRLVVAGLLDRREATDDRRNVALTLTEEGENLIDTVLHNRRAVFGGIAADMAPSEQRQVTKALRMLVATARDRGADDGRVDGSPPGNQLEPRFELLPWLH